MKKKPLILVTNDDGVNSKGIKLLATIAKSYGEVVVVAPDSPQSGMGHAITIGQTLRLDKIELFDDIDTYECSGTPADCVKMARNIVLKDRKPDLVLSGMNHGSNASISVLYSGTMSAAVEAAIEGIPSIGFSLCEYDHNAELDHVLVHMNEIIQSVLSNGLPKGIALNVNFPAKTTEPIKGIKVARQGKARWQEVFEERQDPYKRPYFWLAGDFVSMENGSPKESDITQLEDNYTTVVPCKFDMTCYDTVDSISSWFK